MIIFECLLIYIQEYFPKEVLRKAAELGFAAIYCRDDYGGTAGTRLDASIIFEALSQGCVSTAAYLSIHKYAENDSSKSGICFYMNLVCVHG
jgi:alkylation response protein AidB-like acyl-CoA dehydrogenase